MVKRQINAIALMLYVSFLFQISCDKCYAPTNYRAPTLAANCSELNKVKVSEYKPVPDGMVNGAAIQKHCLHPNEYRDVQQSGLESTVNCARKNRFTETYSYAGKSINNHENDLYINSAKFDGTIIEENGALVYSEDPAKVGAKQGFIAATNAPIGDYRKIVNEFKNIERNNKFEKVNPPLDCGIFEKVPQKCFSGNFLVGGKFAKDNTQLAFYRALKANKISFIVQLTNFAEQPVKDLHICQCKVKADRYFANKANEVFTLSKPDYSPSTAKVLTKSVDLTTYLNTEIRKLEFTDENSKEKYEVTHIHYRAWQDFSVPTGEDQKTLMKIIKLIRDEKVNKKKNIIVHCTGGIGRTGTFISAVLTSNLDKDKKFNLVNFILKLREKRADFVETDGQVELVMKNMVETSTTTKSNLSKMKNSK